VKSGKSVNESVGGPASVTSRPTLARAVPIRRSRSFVNRGSVWNPTAHPPTTRYSAFESANADNGSLKSGRRSMLPLDHPCIDERPPHRAQARARGRRTPEFEPLLFELRPRSGDATLPCGASLGGSLLEGVVHSLRIPPPQRWRPYSKSELPDYAEQVDALVI
jgi:hypothetical protein